MLLFNPSPTGFAAHFLRMMRTLRLKHSLRGTVHLQELIALKFRNEEGNFAMIKDDQYFHQRHIFIKWKSSPHSSEDGLLKPAPLGEAPVRGPYAC